ncbi:hypothetical protein HDU86_004252 [Geranomyces michiganensis]|nr:hypothetical protein HDU86_004252 [Geranomyces michiganensis]
MSTPRSGTPLPSFSQFAQSLAAAGPTPSTPPLPENGSDFSSVSNGSNDVRKTHFIPGKFLDILREDASAEPVIPSTRSASRSLARPHARDLRNLDPTENLTGPRKKQGRLAEKIFAAVTDILHAKSDEDAIFGSDLSSLADALEITSVLPSASGKTFYICFQMPAGGELSSREVDSILQMYEAPLRKLVGRRIRNAPGAWFPSLKFLRDANPEKMRELEDLLDEVQREMDDQPSAK